MKNTKEIMKSKNETIVEEKTDFNAARKRGGSRERLSEAEMPLLFLVPLVETAWAHGAIARNEKQLIFMAAREEDIDEKHRLNDTLDGLLTYQPGQHFFDDCLSLIKSELAAMTVKERELKRSRLVGRCRQIAAVAAGNSVMDIDKSISPEEREVLMRLTSELNFRDEDAARERLPLYATGKTNRPFVE
jgi:hypothetical protein